MKFKVLLVFLLALVAFPLVSSAEVDLKSEIREGEAFFAKVSGKFVDPPSEENILFYREQQKVPFNFDLARVKEDYYVYSPTKDKPSANYSFVIEGVEYYGEGGEKTSESIEESFEISSSTAPFFATPSVLESIEGDFSLNVKNLQGQSIKIDVDKDRNDSYSGGSEGGFFSSLFGGSDSFEGSSYEKSFSLDVAEERKVDFNVENTSQNELRKVDLVHKNFSQSVFVHVLEGDEVKEAEKNEKNIGFEKDEFNFSILTNFSISKFLYLENSARESVENISINVSDSLNSYFSVKPGFIESLGPNETKKITVNISTGNVSKVLKGFVKAQVKEGNSSYARFDINVSDSYSRNNETDEVNVSNDSLGNFSQEEESPETTIEKACGELNGTICSPKEKKCSGETVNAENGRCCLDQCVEKDEGYPVGAIVGWAVLGLLVVVYIWFYLKKYKKTKNKPDLSKFTKKKSSG